ncbi:hypothetical protein HDU98_002267, partial [Podochytrium sp. JEL0797]
MQVSPTFSSFPSDNVVAVEECSSRQIKLKNTSEKHRIANRLAQRAFRERQDFRIRELEGQVASLRATVASLPVAPQSSTTASTTFKPFSDTEVHGSPPTVGSFLKVLKSLPSLHQCMNVDLLLSLFVDQSLQRDSFNIRKRIFQIQKHKHKIYEACDEMDRIKAIEIFCRLRVLNKKHIDIIYNHWDNVRINPAELDPVKSHESRWIRKRGFVYAIRTIPCLRYASAPLLLEIEKLIV